MRIAIQTDPVPLKMDDGGTIRVGGTRMTLDLIIAEHKAGVAPEQIAADYDTLALGDIYAAITYYLHHQAEIDTYLKQRRHALDELRREIEETHPRKGRREGLLARSGSRQAYPDIGVAWKDEWELPVIGDCDHIDILDRFSPICERDVDLLLLEEFNCNPSFCNWFIALLPLPSPSPVHPCCSATHSVFVSGEAAGESDLEIVFTFETVSGSRSVLVLLEDKVTARFTPGQADRYQRRAELARQKKSECFTVLIAPEAYLEPLNCFDVRVRYEDIVEFFDTRAAGALAETGARYRHRAALLRKAIEGPVRVIDPERTRFFADYNSLIVDRHPELRQKPARNRSRNCVVFFFELTPRCSGVKELFLEHKWTEGFVAIEFRGWGTNRRLYVPRLEKIAESDMIVDSPTDQMVRLRIGNLPKLDPDKPLCEQEAAACRGIDVAAKLLAWYRKYCDDFETWTEELRRK